MERSFQHIIDEYNGILYKIGRSYTREQADFDDLYQEMLIQLWKSFPRFRGEAKLSTWIYRVALNTALTYQKKKRGRDKEVELNPEITLSSDSDPDGSAEEKVDLLYACINELKRDQRALILLHLEGESYEEIARIMGITINNVGVRLSRVKTKLHSLLIEKGYGRF
jgi:RNA polymerase sigma-70 factor (ECF subfamily)